MALETRVGGDLPAVEADRDRILQVLLNLLSNALKFCPEGGWIAVDATPWNGSVELAVSDDGCGVSPADRETIFDKFRQVSRPIAGRTHGTGLGLTICREIVHRHGGTIRVGDSERGGARFAFTLPFATEPRP